MTSSESHTSIKNSTTGKFTGLTVLLRVMCPQKAPTNSKMKTRISLGIAFTWDLKKNDCSYSYSDLNMWMRISHQ